MQQSMQYTYSYGDTVAIKKLRNLVCICYIFVKVKKTQIVKVKKILQEKSTRNRVRRRRSTDQKRGL
jgi:hypothetical protein